MLTLGDLLKLPEKLKPPFLGLNTALAVDLSLPLIVPRDLVGVCCRTQICSVLGLLEACPG
jgi:hypothetical protein